MTNSDPSAAASRRPRRGRAPWLDQVKFGRDAKGQAFIYRPHEVLVRDLPGRNGQDARALVIDLIGNDNVRIEQTSKRIALLRLPNGFDAPTVARYLRGQGFKATCNHVFFADGEGELRLLVHGNPVTFGSLANPVTFGSLANPVTFGSLANPVTFGSVGAALMAGACCEDCFGTYQSPTVPDQAPLQTLALATDAPTYVPRSSTIGQGLRVLVLDTGLALAGYRPTMDPTVSCDDPSGDDQPDPGDDKLVDPAAGHGTFIASIISRMAPGATVDVIQVLNTFGLGIEQVIGDVIDNLPADAYPDIISMSFSGYTEDDLPPAGLTDALQRAALKGTILVSSAGNSASCRPAWPGAMPEVIAVGALGPTGPAPFTNFGPWVKACAPGVNIVSQFFQQTDATLPPIPADGDDHPFEGWAMWSGTSFSGPIVVGVLLAAVNPTTLAANRRLALSDAVDAVIHEPHLARMPALGTIVNAYP